MKLQLNFEIECGKTTCAVRPGEFCRYFRNNLKGSGSCYFFGGLTDKDGWIQRHRDCVSLAKGQLMDKNLIQTVIIVTASGKKAIYTGPVQLEEDDRCVSIKVIKPDKPLPAGCSWSDGGE